MEVTAQMVKELRSQTGAGIMDCKEALREKNGDFEEAARYLREKGLASAAKKAGREASEGQVGALVEPDGRLGVLLEVNCETDFVARTDDFRALLSQVAEHVAREGAEGLPPNPGGEPIRESVAAAIAKLGENIVVAQAERFALPEGQAGRVVSYIHPGGRIGVLVDVRCASDGVAASPEFVQTAKDLAMHIAASNPLYLRPDLIPPSVLESERVILFAQQKDSRKPEHIVAKIVEGRLNKYMKEICLLEQPFVKDPDQTVQAMLSARGEALGEEIAVSRWARFQLGDRSGRRMAN